MRKQNKDLKNIYNPISVFHLQLKVLTGKKEKLKESDNIYKIYLQV